MDQENHSSDSPLEPWVDPTLEARIVALILGEASDFEKAELLGAIEDQPELKAFYKRIHDTHSALQRAESPSHSTHETAWKLPAEKREALLEQFRSPADPATPALAPASVDQRRKRTRLAPWLAIAAAIILLATAGVSTLAIRAGKNSAETLISENRRMTLEDSQEKHDMAWFKQTENAKGNRLATGRGLQTLDDSVSNGGLDAQSLEVLYSHQVNRDRLSLRDDGAIADPASIDRGTSGDWDRGIAPANGQTRLLAEAKSDRLYDTVDSVQYFDRASDGPPGGVPDSRASGEKLLETETRASSASYRGRFEAAPGERDGDADGFVGRSAKAPAPTSFAAGDSLSDLGILRNVAPGLTAPTPEITNFRSDLATSPAEPDDSVRLSSMVELAAGFSSGGSVVRVEDATRPPATSEWQIPPSTTPSVAAKFTDLPESIAKPGDQSVALGVDFKGNVADSDAAKGFAVANGATELERSGEPAPSELASELSDSEMEGMELAQTETEEADGIVSGNSENSGIAPGLGGGGAGAAGAGSTTEARGADGEDRFGREFSKRRPITVPGSREPQAAVDQLSELASAESPATDTLAAEFAWAWPVGSTSLFFGGGAEEYLADTKESLGRTAVEQEDLFAIAPPDSLELAKIPTTTTAMGEQSRAPGPSGPTEEADSEDGLARHDHSQPGGNPAAGGGFSDSTIRLLTSDSAQVQMRLNGILDFAESDEASVRGGEQPSKDREEGKASNRELEYTATKHWQHTGAATGYGIVADNAPDAPGGSALTLDALADETASNWYGFDITKAPASKEAAPQAQPETSTLELTDRWAETNSDLLEGEREIKPAALAGEASLEDRPALEPSSGAIAMNATRYHAPAEALVTPEHLSIALKSATRGNQVTAEVAPAEDLIEELEEARKEISTENASSKLSRAKAEPDLSLETLTSDEPFSTFSLNVSDVSFKLARTALLDNNSFPEGAKVRVEEFVNAFNYGDQAPSLSEKVACHIDQAAHPFLQQRNLMRVSMQTAAAGRAASQPLRLTILLDKSGSMERADREESVLRTMQALAKHLGAADLVTAVAFARQPHLIADQLSGDRADELVGLVAATPSEGGTNLEEALKLAGSLATRQFDDNATNRIVLITDGAANLGDADPESLKEKIIALRQRGIAFDACGVGADGLNDTTLEALTRKGDGRYYFLDRPEDADANFVRQLAGSLRPAAKNVKVQVKFNPERVSRYRLAGFEKHRLDKEDFRDDKIDAAEMAAAESGNAIYQFEADPQGSGDIGEVSVRFLDTSSGQMVERSWPIPYQANAPRLSEAKPAIQLAATAAFLGEKLKGGPAADSIDLAELAPITNQLRNTNRAPEVQQLIQMVERARSLQP